MAKKFPTQDQIEAQNLMERYVSPDVTPVEKRRIEARIFQKFQPLIFGTAAKMSNNNDELREHLEEEAILGFDKAMKKYKTDGAKFSYYATRIVRDVCMGSLRSFYNMTTGVEAHLLYNMSKILSRINKQHKELNPAELDEKIVDEVLKYRKKSGEPITTNREVVINNLQSYREKMGFNFALSNPAQSILPDGGDLFDIIEDRFAPEGSSALIDKDEQELLRSLFIEALSSLPAKSTDIFLERKQTIPMEKNVGETHQVKLEELAEKYDLTRERVRQLEVAGGQQIRGAFLRVALQRGITEIGARDLKAELEKLPPKFRNPPKVSGERYDAGPNWICPE